jgi:hypothetical protein
MLAIIDVAWSAGFSLTFIENDAPPVDRKER